MSDVHRVFAASAASAALSSALVLLGGAMQPARAAGLVPFAQFVAGLAEAPLAATTSTAASPTSAAAMRGHLMGLYAGVTVKHSYMRADHPFDCVPIMQQPSVRALGLKALSSAPAVPSSPKAALAAAESAQVPPAAAPSTDPYGNTMACEEGTIPMRRVTMEDVGRFATLADFLRKGPRGGSAPQRPDPTLASQATDVHKYAYGYQYVTNFGGSTDINVLAPKVDTGRAEVFSLSQFWYVNTTAPVQTVEGGSQVYPQMYGTDQPSLFVYWTSDDYDQVGCYNLTCPGFVQTSGAYELGGPLPRVSTLLGAQYYLRMSAVKQNGDWWIYIGGIDPSRAIGYYPAAVFHGRPITTSSDLIEYGGEVVGTGVWPQMGSGSFAQARFRHAAAQKQITWLPPSYDAVQANLSVKQPSIGCYTDVTNDSSGYPGWNTFFYFGGPGGTGC